MRRLYEKLMRDPWLATITVGGILLVFIVGTIALVRPEPREALPRKESSFGTPQNSETETSSATVIPDSQFVGPVVRYTESGFSPSRVLLTTDNAKTTECLIKIQNASRAELVLRLGPPSERDNRGFSYAPIPTGESLIIDPRYSGIFEAEFYNRTNYDHTLFVSFVAACFE